MYINYIRCSNQLWTVSSLRIDHTVIMSLMYCYMLSMTVYVIQTSFNNILLINQNINASSYIVVCMQLKRMGHVERKKEKNTRYNYNFDKNQKIFTFLISDKGC